MWILNNGLMRLEYCCKTKKSISKSEKKKKRSSGLSVLLNPVNILINVQPVNYNANK